MLKVKVGMYGGSFNPIHNGHVKCIKKALENCEELHLIVGYLPNRDDFPIEVKLSWIKEIFKDYDNLHIHVLTDESKEKTEYTLDKWIADSQIIKKMINKHIDGVFAGSDYNVPNSPYLICYPDSVLTFFDRGDNISSSRFKLNPDKYKDDVPECVYKSYKEKILNE